MESDSKKSKYFEKKSQKKNDSQFKKFEETLQKKKKITND